MDKTEEAEQKKKVIRWLAIGSGVMLLIILAMVFIGSLLDNREEAATKITLPKEDLAVAERVATDFITTAGTFGISDEALAADSLDFTKSQLSKNSGSYGNLGFGLSRGENYRLLSPQLDPRGEQDTSEQFAAKLDSYYPDWTGQILQYKASDVLITAEDPYLAGSITLLPLKVSFTSNVRLFSDGSVSANSSTWEEFTGDSFQTVAMTLSLQPNGTWKIWAIDDLETKPYILSTWSEPNWKVSSPNKAELVVTQ